MKRPEKEAVVAQLTDKFRNADAIYLTEYRGLPFRRSLNCAKS